MFAAIGLIFLVLPDGVLLFFNNLSRVFGMTEAPIAESGFYLILAVGYMYLVTILAFFMYRHPRNVHFSLLLINAKSASSILSFLFFAFSHPYLIFLANGIIDGAIAAGLLILRAKMKGIQQ